MDGQNSSAHEATLRLGVTRECTMSETTQKKPAMTVREAGQKGGEIVKKKYGPGFYESIGRKGGLATKEAHGHAFYEQIGKKGGKKGGEATRDRHGPDFYEQIGQKGGQRVKQLIEEGKRAAAAAAAAGESKHNGEE